MMLSHGHFGEARSTSSSAGRQRPAEPGGRPGGRQPGFRAAGPRVRPAAAAGAPAGLGGALGRAPARRLAAGPGGRRGVADPEAGDHDVQDGRAHLAGPGPAAPGAHPRRHRLEPVGRRGAAHGPPDDVAAEARRSGTHGTSPLWVGASDGVQVSVRGARPSDLELVLIDPGVLPGDATVSDPQLARTLTTTGAPRPSIHSRKEWGADESWRERASWYNRTIQQVHVHHTVDRQHLRGGRRPGPDPRACTATTRTTWAGPTSATTSSWTGSGARGSAAPAGPASPSAARTRSASTTPRSASR